MAAWSRGNSLLSVFALSNKIKAGRELRVFFLSSCRQCKRNAVQDSRSKTKTTTKCLLQPRHATKICPHVFLLLLFICVCVFVCLFVILILIGRNKDCVTLMSNIFGLITSQCFSFAECWLRFASSEWNHRLIRMVSDEVRNSGLFVILTNHREASITINGCVHRKESTKLNCGQILQLPQTLTKMTENRTGSNVRKPDKNSVLT